MPWPVRVSLEAVEKVTRPTIYLSIILIIRVLGAYLLCRKRKQGGPDIMIIPLLYILLVLLSNCNNPSTPSLIIPASFSYSYISGKAISTFFDTTSWDTTLEYTLVPGRNFVFNYRYTREEDRQIVDDEYSEHLVFQADSTTDSFYFQNSNLDSLTCLFSRSCSCYEHGRYNVDSGYIRGNKTTDSTWHIVSDLFVNVIITKDINRTTTELRNVKFDAIFNRQQ